MVLTRPSFVDSNDSEDVLFALSESSHRPLGNRARALSTLVPHAELGLFLDDPLLDLAAAVRLGRLPAEVDAVHVPVLGEGLARLGGHRVGVLDRDRGK